MLYQGGSRGMLTRKIFENFHTAVAILVLFEEFLGKFSGTIELLLKAAGSQGAQGLLAAQLVKQGTHQG